MKYSRPLVVVMAAGLAILPAACSTLTGSSGTAKKSNPSDSTVFRTITVVVQTTQTTAPAATGAATGAQSAAATQTTLDPSIYEVVGGDSWYGIAKKLKVDVNALLAANNATLGSALYPGRRLAKPAANATTGTGTGTGGVLPPPGAGSSGGATATSAATPTLAPGSASGSYQIQAGDYWLGIAKKLNVSLNQLLAANGATTSTVLLVGKYLKVPQG